jgi:hypothetical protein
VDREPLTTDWEPEPRRERRRSFAVRLVVAGFALAVLSIVVAALAGNVTGAFSHLFLGLPAVVGLLLVFVTAGAFVPALVIATLCLLLSLLGGSGDLAHPQSFADFVPAFLRLVGFAAAVAGAWIGRRARRTRTLHRATRRERLGLRIATVAVIGVAVASYALTRSARTVLRTPEGALVVWTDGDEFDPDELHLSSGRVQILVRNTDSYAHSFTIDDLTIDEYVPPESDKLLTLDVDVPSTLADEAARGLVLSCVVTGHESMEGTVVIED